MSVKESWWIGRLGRGRETTHLDLVEANGLGDGLVVVGVARASRKSVKICTRNQKERVQPAVCSEQGLEGSSPVAMRRLGEQEDGPS